VRQALARINPKVPAEAIEEAIRDALLPKLISGEIRVKDADKSAGSVL